MSNELTQLMHLYTLHEIKKLHLTNKIALKKIADESSVILEKAGKPRIGKFDFLVETKAGKTIGFEILTRPTQGKMLGKLRYAKGVDEFVFVLPSMSLEFYRKPKKKVSHRKIKPKFFSGEFADAKLRAWLFDLQNEQFLEKGKFNNLFNVKI